MDRREMAAWCPRCDGSMEVENEQYDGFRRPKTQENI